MASPLLLLALLLSASASDEPNEYRLWEDRGHSPMERAEALLAQMTLQDKVDMVHGYGFGWKEDGYVGSVKGNTRLGIPGVADGVSGVTAWPSALTVAASWDVSLMKDFAMAMAKEQRGKGSNVMLGPMVNIARVPRGGRNFESFGEDPFLAGQMARAYVKGTQQQGVAACVKHFALNSFEEDRMTVSADVDERTQWELYYPAFQAAIEAGVVSVMCAYNRINGTYSCENPQALKDLKDTMGFQGWVMSDWGATHSTTPSATAGLDQEMPSDAYLGDSLYEAVQNGDVPEARLNDMVLRILWGMFSVGIFDRPQASGVDGLVDPVTSRAHNALALKLAQAGTVLLKNDQALPLHARSLTKVAVLGDDADRKPIIGGGGSGAVEPPYIITPLAAITKRAARGGFSVTYQPTGDNELAAKTASAADVAIIFVATTSTEGADRDSLSLGPEQDALVREVVSVQPRTVVVVHGPGAVLMPWADEVPAIVMGFMPGQADGRAIAAVLFGDVNPYGRLPLSFPRTEDDTWLQSEKQYPGIDKRSSYSEGLQVGYRWYDSQDMDPLFPFGHGLSYSRFTYRNLAMEPSASNVIVRLEVVNNGPHAVASEVVQLYISFPPEVNEPPKQLKGFQVVNFSQIKERKGALFVLTKRDMSIWSVAKHSWELVSGRFELLIGSSSRDIKLRASLDVEEDVRFR